MLYEDTSVDVNSDKRFHVELHFSPGAYADFDAPAYLIKSTVVNEELQNDSSNLSTSCTSHQSSSPSSTGKSKLIHHYLNKNEKKSPVSTMIRRYPNKKFSKELQTLPEPNDGINIADISLSTQSDTSNNGNKRFTNLKFKILIFSNYILR